MLNSVFTWLLFGLVVFPSLALQVGQELNDCDENELVFKEEEVLLVWDDFEDVCSLFSLIMLLPELEELLLDDSLEFYEEDCGLILLFCFDELLVVS